MSAPLCIWRTAAHHSVLTRGLRAPSGYLNRYGTGLVIYWFGYDASVDTDPRLLLMTEFPTDCEIMTVYAT